jgi:hypothetical protein
MGTPIINLPQTAVLGLHAIKDKAVVVDGKIEIRPMMYLALTYDHRLLDGREAVTFLVKVSEIQAWRRDYRADFMIADQGVHRGSRQDAHPRVEFRRGEVVALVAGCGGVRECER